MSLDPFLQFPIATASAAAFYMLLLALALPSARRVIMPRLEFPPDPGRQQYLLGFDTFRGFAAALVAMAHCWYLTYPVFDHSRLWLPFLGQGAKGVPMFAVLSGFLIYRSVLLIGSLADLRIYIVRRFFRIYPVYLLSVMLCLIAGQYFATTTYTGVGYMVADLFMFRVAWWPAFGNPVTWSLYIEVVFYAFLPLAVLILGRERMVGAAAIGLIAMVVADHASREFTLWRYFLIGILASELTPYFRRVALPAFLLGAVLLAIDIQGPAYDWASSLVGQKHLDGSTLGLGLACFLILVSLPHLRRIAAALNVLPLRLLGLISYSVFMIHLFYILANFPQMEFFTNIGTMPIHEKMKLLPQMPVWYLPLFFFPGALMWGLVSYVLIERPGINAGRHLVARARAVSRRFASTSRT